MGTHGTVLLNSVFWFFEKPAAHSCHQSPWNIWCSFLLCVFFRIALWTQGTSSCLSLFFWGEAYWIMLHQNNILFWIINFLLLFTCSSCVYVVKLSVVKLSMCGPTLPYFTLTLTLTLTAFPIYVFTAAGTGGESIYGPQFEGVLFVFPVSSSALGSFWFEAEPLFSGCAASVIWSKIEMLNNKKNRRIHEFNDSECGPFLILWRFFQMHMALLAEMVFFCIMNETNRIFQIRISKITVTVDFPSFFVIICDKGISKSPSSNQPAIVCTKWNKKNTFMCTSRNFDYRCSLNPVSTGPLLCMLCMCRRKFRSEAHQGGPAVHGQHGPLHQWLPHWSCGMVSTKATNLKPEATNSHTVFFCGEIFYDRN